MQEQERDSHLLLLAVEVGLLAVLGGGVELRPQVLELLHTIITKQKFSRIPGETEQELVLFFLYKKRKHFCARECMDLGMRGSGSTCRALMKLLLRSMDASSTVVGPAPAPATPPQAPAAGRQCCGGCIPPYSLPLRRRACRRREQRTGTGREGGGEGKSRKRSTGTDSVGGVGWSGWKRASDASPTPTRRKLILLPLPPPVSLLLTPRAWGVPRARVAVERWRWSAEEEEGSARSERPQRWL